MKKFILILLLFAMFPLMASDLSDYKKAETYISQNNIDSALTILSRLYKTSKDTSILPGVILHIADLTSNAALSANYYKELYKKYPKRKEATIALIRLGQYYYALDAYKMSISYFSKALKHPISNFARLKVQYWLGKSFSLLGKDDSARTYFSMIMREDTLSPYYKLSKMSLKMLGGKGIENGTVRIETIKNTTKKYGIQIGIFSDRDNAKKLNNKYKNKGYDAFIVPTSINGKNEYRVIIGRFKSKSDAEDYINVFRKAEGIACWITTIND